MSNIIDIHIHRTSAGVSIPFDKIYLIKPEDKELIPRIFGFGIVLPFSDEMKDAVFTLRTAHISRKHFHRYDDHKRIQPTINDSAIVGEKHSAASLKRWWQELDAEINLSSRLVVVPVLTSIARRRIRPRYLANKKWFSTNVQRHKTKEVGRKKKTTLELIHPAIGELAYLATPLAPPQDKIRPLCAICPRMLRHFQGDCVPGQPVCYESLNFADINKTEDAVEAPTEETPDASVQPDDY